MSNVEGDSGRADRSRLDPKSELGPLWSARLARGLEPWAPQLADVMTDGAWMEPYGRIAAVAPPAALLVAFLGRLFLPGITHVYSESFLFLAFAVAGGIISGPVGAMTLFGYVLGDVLGGGGFGAGSALGTFGSRLIAYILLALLVCVIPHVARSISDSCSVRMPVSIAGRGGIRRWLVLVVPIATRAGYYAVSSALLVSLWCQATIVLVRPVFTWVRSTPTVDSIRNVQHHWDWLALVAIAAAVTRVLLEAHAATGSTDARPQRTGGDRRGAFWRQIPAVLRIGIVSGAATLLLAGTFTGWLDAVLALVVIALLVSWNRRLIGRVPVAWVILANRLPALVRVGLAPLLGYGLAKFLLEWRWSSGSFRPVMFGALLTLALFFALFPPFVRTFGTVAETERTV